MLTSVRGILAATFSAGLAIVATPAFADETTAAPYGPVSDADVDRAIEQVTSEESSNIGLESGFEFSANVALTTDYRFRGVSLSAGDVALQGGFDISHSSGLYVGTWASSIAGGDAYGDLEVDIYGGWGGDLMEGVSFDVGLLYYMYPTEESADGFDDNVNYWEPYASVGFTFGPASTTLGVAYAWNQDSLGDDDNLYLYLDAEAGLPGTPLTLSGHIGYTDGALAPDFVSGFGPDRTAWDWSIGASAELVGPLSLSVAYVGVEDSAIEAFGAGDSFTNDTVVATLSASF